MALMRSEWVNEKAADIWISLLKTPPLPVILSSPAGEREDPV